jgi:hypothetical protein
MKACTGKKRDFYYLSILAAINYYDYIYGCVSGAHLSILKNRNPIILYDIGTSRDISHHICCGFNTLCIGDA